MKPNLSVKFAGIFMKNPVMNAAGTFDADEDSVKLYRAKEIGAVVTKTICLNKIVGNPPAKNYGSGRRVDQSDRFAGAGSKSFCGGKDIRV